MKTIIVPTDFSGNALYAANYAAELASMLGAGLNLLHVYTLPAQVTEVPFAFDITQIEKDAATSLAAIKEKLITRTGGRVAITTAIKQGDVMTEIAAYCEAIKPYAVVMGAESMGAFERLLVGGKTLSAVRKLPWPLIIVPPFTTFKNIRKIGLACDFREVVESVRAKEIRDLVREFKAELHIIYVTDEYGSSFDNETIEESGLLQEMLGDLKPKYHFINEPTIDDAINRYAEKNKLDLLIIVPKKHKLLDRIFSTSESRRIVLNAQVPILSLHE